MGGEGETANTCRPMVGVEEGDPSNMACRDRYY